MHETVLAPVSIGDLIDRITILKLKITRIHDTGKRNRAAYEYDRLVATRERLVLPHDVGAAVNNLAGQLHEVNGQLWDVEDQLRRFEHLAEFQKPFIQAARSVYHLNDKRARVKREINILGESDIIEEKSYGQPATPYPVFGGTGP